LVTLFCGCFCDNLADRGVSFWLAGFIGLALGDSYRGASGAMNEI